MADRFFYWAGYVTCVGIMLGVVAVVWVWAIDRMMTMCRIKWVFLQWAAEYYAKQRAEKKARNVVARVPPPAGQGEGK